MIKTNLLTTIVLNDETEVIIKTSDTGQVIVEMPVPKCPFHISELREALDLCEDFITKRKNETPAQGIPTEVTYIEHETVG